MAADKKLARRMLNLPGLAASLSKDSMTCQRMGYPRRQVRELRSRTPMKIPIVSFLSAFFFQISQANERHDVVVYGGTSAGVIAAVQAKKMGKSAVIVCPDIHLGGLSSGGLGWTDSGKKEVIGGLSRDFYHRVFLHYDKAESWKWQKPSEYGNRGQGTAAIDGSNRTMWIFEPHVAEQIFEDYVREFDIAVHRDEWLDREDGIVMKNGRIEQIKTLSGKVFSGRMFIDATYEGDLMVAAGVSYTVGREANAKYKETLNGVQTKNAVSHQFDKPVDPYVVPGDPSSGLLPRIHGDSPGIDGEGDHRVQAYCFRTCMTDHEPNRLPFPKPEEYDPRQYELALRYFQAGWKDVFRKFDPIPNHKTDTNNHGGFSFDNIGYNYDYPEASYERRREIIKEHETYQKGLLWFIANDPRVPKDIQAEMRRWGLAKDEFTDNGHWPHQIYVREARRMVSEVVVNENHLRYLTPTERPVGMGSYNMDSHHTQRYVDRNGHARNEGDIQRNPGGPYPIDYGAIIPRKAECQNLIVPVAVSSSHIAYGSIRMEPVFMILGQSAATAACLSLDEKVAVQDLPFELLETRLLADGQVLAWTNPRGTLVSLDQIKGVVIDDTKAELKGDWKRSSIVGGVHQGYLHDGDLRDGSCTATFTTELEPGTYDLLIAYTPNENRATNVPITVLTGREIERFTLDQKAPPKNGLFHPVAQLMLGGTTKVILSNHGTNGHVIVDAIRFLKQ